MDLELAADVGTAEDSTVASIACVFTYIVPEDVAPTSTTEATEAYTRDLRRDGRPLRGRTPWESMPRSWAPALCARLDGC
ncbi:hypothetical protein AB0H18_35320 [Streptomyces sp. NPDC020766]|uniref:hypothetical protein n=1 Tax=Streptomyces sp. NPDC020766 TaxID=3155011 RepID=UPI003410031A